MKQILTRQETGVILEPYYNKIVDAISGGFSDYIKVLEKFNQEGKKIDFKKATIASMVHDFTKARIKETFTEIENVETKEFNKIFGIHIDNKILIRFKKINKDFTTSNIQTKQTIRFEHQLEIEGFPPQPTYLYAGYMPDETWVSIKNIYLICKQGGNLIWRKDLTGMTEEQTNIKFVSIEEPQEETTVRRVKIKTTGKKVSKITG